MDTQSTVVALVIAVGLLLLIRALGGKRTTNAPDIAWSIPGSTCPEECTITTLIEREAAGEQLNSSELIIAYHSIPDDLAAEIATKVLTPEEAVIFDQLRGIPPSRFRRETLWWNPFDKPQPITWLDYATEIGHTMDSFWRVWDGVGGRIIDYIKHRPTEA